jgi:hypothetical protein
MNFDRVESEQVQAIHSQLEAEIKELEEMQMAMVGGGVGEVVVG